MHQIPTIPMLNIINDKPRQVLRDMALKSDVEYSGWLSTRRNPHDIFTATIDKVERFVRAVIRLSIIGAAISLFSLGAMTGGALAGGIFIFSGVTIYTLQKKSRAIKDEYAKVYSFGWNYIRSLIQGSFTLTQPRSLRLVKGLY